MRKKHLFGAGVSRGLVAVADHDRHDVHIPAHFLDLELARFEVLRIQPGHGLRNPFRAAIKNHPESASCTALMEGRAITRFAAP